MPIHQLSDNFLRKTLKGIKAPYVFLETNYLDKDNSESLLFSNPLSIIEFNHNDNIKDFFSKIQKLSKKGLWLAGFFSYEFGYYLEPALSSCRKKNYTPLAWLGAFKKPLRIDHKNPQIKEESAPLFLDSNYSINNIRPNIGHSQYAQQIKKIKHYLQEGLTYQVNYTFKVNFDFAGSPIDFYLDLRHTQPTSYSSLINTGRENFISLSPELFFKKEANKMTTRPMKGTTARGLNSEDEKELVAEFKKNKKIKAENLMIVDLLRNDLGRISDKVKVLKLFEVEKYRTLYQMTSTINADLKPRLGWQKIFSALFPSGSVTGAPKIKTMQLIQELEKEPRGLYTGSIGYIAPDKTACFNIAIRTAHIINSKGELGIGGGIVYDSDQQNELNEALLKGKFLIEKLPKLALIETILWDEATGYFLLDLHLERLKQSADFFCIPLDLRKLKIKLKNVISSTQGKQKVRILLHSNGYIHAEKSNLVKLPESIKVKISSQRLDPENKFLYHKTTNRGFYNQQKRLANQEGFFETIFLNTEGELTEGTISNIFIVKKGKMYTPALSCGLLPGVLRSHLINIGKASERILYLKDLLLAQKVYIGNSVRGLIPVELSNQSQNIKEIEKVLLSDRI